MLLKIMTQLVYWARLGNIPEVSAWVGSHRWARILAWWVFPSIFWTVIIAGLREAVLLLSNLGLHLTHDLSNSMWLLLLLPVFLCTLIALFLSIALGAPTTLYSSLFEPSRPHNECPAAGSWLDYLDPDYALKVPYAHTAVRKVNNSLKNSC